MQLKTNHINNVLSMSLEEKRFDSRLSITFKEQVNQFVNAGHRLIILDLSAVEFIDSSAIGCLVACLKLIGTKGQFVLWGLKAPVESMFKLTRMDRIFKICATEEGALQAVVE